MIRIAIDGPAASGKTTLGQALAQRFDCLFVETGRMYRAIAMGLDKGLELNEITIELGEGGRYFLNQVDVTDLLHTPDLDRKSSQVATDPQVREKLVRVQREIAKKQNVVMEGRDIGTVVLPDAQIKLFLCADPLERAKRRANQRNTADIASVFSEIEKRDKRDQTRSVSPLNAARDALIIDTDRKSLEDVISEAVALVEERLRYVDTPTNRSTQR